MHITINVIRTFIKDCLQCTDNTLPAVDDVDRDAVCLFIDYLTLHPNSPASDVLDFASSVLGVEPEHIQHLLEIGPDSAIGRELTRTVGKSDVPRFSVTPGFEHLRGQYTRIDDVRFKQTVKDRNDAALSNLGLFIDDPVAVHNVSTPPNCQWYITSTDAPIGYVQVCLYDQLRMQVINCMQVEILRLHRVGSSLFEIDPQLQQQQSSISSFVNGVRESVNQFVQITEHRKRRKHRRHRKRGKKTHLPLHWLIGPLDYLSEVPSDDSNSGE